jgi:hypothetical protein
MNEITNLPMLGKISKKARKERITRLYPRLSGSEQRGGREKDCGLTKMLMNIILVRFFPLLLECFTDGQMRQIRDIGIILPTSKVQSHQGP